MIKDPINILQNNNFIEIIKHINSYWVENIPDMDPKLLAAINLPNLQGIKKKKKLGLKIVLSFSLKVFYQTLVKF